MHHYVVSFSSETLDEGRLRDLLTDHFGIKGCSISRENLEDEMLQDGAGADTAAVPNTELVLAFARTVDMFAPRDLLAQYPQLSIASACRACISLCERGALNRIVHGIYSLEGPEKITAEAVERNQALRRVENPRADPRRVDDALLEFLVVGRDTAEVQGFMGVSRQRVQHKLSELMSLGLVCRVPHDGRRFLYALDQRAVPTPSDAGAPALTQNGRLILRLIPEAGLIEMQALHAAVAELKIDLSYSSLNKVVDSLIAKELVKTERVGRNKCLTLTQRGKAHPVRSPGDRRLPASDPAALYGERRATILLSLDGRNLTAAEISDAMLLAGVSTIDLGELLGDLRKGDLVEKVPGQGRMGPYRLGATGRDLVKVMKRFRLTTGAVEPKES